MNLVYPGREATPDVRAQPTRFIFQGSTLTTRVARGLSPDGTGSFARPVLSAGSFSSPGFQQNQPNACQCGGGGMADTPDLESGGPQGPCEFDPRSPHQTDSRLPACAERIPRGSVSVNDLSRFTWPSRTKRSDRLISAPAVGASVSGVSADTPLGAMPIYGTAGTLTIGRPSRPAVAMISAIAKPCVWPATRTRALTAGRDVVQFRQPK